MKRVLLSLIALAGAMSIHAQVVSIYKNGSKVFSVADADSVVFSACTENGHEWVDLGLSVKWATCNVGATTPDGYGDYFAWGETNSKNNYDWSTYKYCTPYSFTYNMTKYCTGYYGTIDNKTTLELTDDVARVNWGGNWRMPTYDEMNELKTQCTWTWITQNNINGYKIVGPNKNSIFLPVAGYYDENDLKVVGFYGYYWSSSLDTDSSDFAYCLSFRSNLNCYSLVGGYRYYGSSVRAVLP
ncbi:MAG: hypothetical protein MJZ75_06755 [Paludibacteraceae bacterium]|nr:hypothetical protein [Paludibacteraceae bacterium]